jgi:hypothetical protein
MLDMSWHPWYDYFNNQKQMTTTFEQFQSEQDAKNTIQLNVTKWCYMLIDALKQNYTVSAINGHKNSIRCAKRDENIDYHLIRIAELKNGDCSIDYIIESGKKYHKIILVDGGGSRSVHCFVDKKTGELYKSASWKAPAKGVRFDLRIIRDREYLLQNADWAGGYLYK